MKRRNFIEASSLALLGVPLLLSCAEDVISKGSTIISEPTSKKKLKVAITAPGGGVFNLSLVKKTKSFLEAEGYEVVLKESLFTTTGYFSLEDQSRAKELNELFLDESIDIIMCARGGWGCNRIIPFLDLDAVKNNPKIFIGFSDITTLINLFQDKCNLITYHGNMAYSSWGDFSYSSFKKVLGQKETVLKNHSSDKPIFLSSGIGSGKLIGGNLTVLTSMIGTNYEPDWKNRILCLEETHEEPYRIDRMLNQLKDSGIFEKVNGVILGQFNKCTPEEPDKSFSLDEVLNHYFNNFGKPVMSNASFGHVTNKFVIPIGRMASLNSENQSIELL